MTMPLQRVGTTTCPVCGETAPVFRRGFLNPITHQPIYAISLHWQGSASCPGAGKRVTLEQVTRA